jgi:hypothetical protein
MRRWVRPLREVIGGMTLRREVDGEERDLRDGAEGAWSRKPEGGLLAAP